MVYTSACSIQFRPVMVWHLFIENQPSDPLSPSSIDDTLLIMLQPPKVSECFGPRGMCFIVYAHIYVYVCIDLCVCVHCTWMVEYMRKAGGIDCFWRARSTNSTKITKQNERERGGGERPTKEQKLLECHKILCHLLYHSLSIVNVGFVSKWHASGRYTFWPQFFSAFICSVGRPFIHFVLDCWSVRFRCIFTSNSVFLIRFIFVSFSSSSFFIAKINVCCVLKGGSSFRKKHAHTGRFIDIESNLNNVSLTLFGRIMFYMYA